MHVLYFNYCVVLYIINCVKNEHITTVTVTSMNSFTNIVAAHAVTTTSVCWRRWRWWTTRTWTSTSTVAGVAVVAGVEARCYFAHWVLDEHDGGGGSGGGVDALCYK